MNVLMFLSAVVLLDYAQAAVKVPTLTTSATVLETSTKSPVQMGVLTTVLVPLTHEVVAHVVEVKMEPKPLMKSVKQAAAEVEQVSTSNPSQIVITSTETTATVKNDPCDLVCTKMDLNPVCATNENCVHEFPNECVMLIYNCRHSAAQPFKVFKNEPCNNEVFERKLTKVEGGSQQARQEVQQDQHQNVQHHQDHHHQDQTQDQHHHQLHPSLQPRCTPEDLNGFVHEIKA